MQQLRSELQDELRILVEENGRLQQENNELRAECAELHEARGLLDYIKTQHDLPPAAAVMDNDALGQTPSARAELDQLSGGKGI